MAEFGKGPISGDLVHPEAEGFEGATAEDIEACREEHRKICERRGRRVMAGKILGKDLKVPDPSEDIPVRAGRFEEGECRVEYSEGFPEGEAWDGLELLLRTEAGLKIWAREDPRVVLIECPWREGSLWDELVTWRPPADKPLDLKEPEEVVVDPGEGDCLGVMPLVFRGKPPAMVVNQASRAARLVKRMCDNGLVPGQVVVATSQEYESFVGGDVTFMDVSDDAALAPEGSRERHYRCMDCGWSGPQSEAGVKPELSRIQLLCPSCLRPDTIKFES